MITRETISQSEQRWDPSAVGWITDSSPCFQGTDQPTMKSQCWGREAKPCLSQRSGCCSLLKCQVLLKNNTPPPLARSPSSAQCLPSLLHTRLQPVLEQRLRNEPLDWPAGPTAAFLLPSFVYVCMCIYIFISIILFFPLASPLWPLRWKQQGWWNEPISFLPCSHFPAAVTLLPSILSISSPVSLDFSHDVVRALIGQKYHKHHRTHLLGKRRLHMTNYMVHFSCGVSDDGDWIIWW